MKSKLPVQQKAKMPSNINDVFGNPLKIPESIAKDLKEKGLVPRFISIKKVMENAGQHDKGWTIYKLPEPIRHPITGNLEETYRVKDLILAVKSKEDHQKHQEYLRLRANMQSQSPSKMRKEIRDRIKEAKASSYVSMIDGYEENE